PSPSHRRNGARERGILGSRGPFRLTIAITVTPAVSIPTSEGEEESKRAKKGNLGSSGASRFLTSNHLRAHPPPPPPPLPTDGSLPLCAQHSISLLRWLCSEAHESMIAVVAAAAAAAAAAVAVSPSLSYPRSGRRPLALASDT
ncbi:hypothetical protein MUK42_29077, partial [Musa troglodytarum]